MSHPNAPAQIEAVNTVLEELGVQNIPTLTVWNKVYILLNAEYCASAGALTQWYLQRGRAVDDGQRSSLAAVPLQARACCMTVFR